MRRGLVANITAKNKAASHLTPLLPAIARAGASVAESLHLRHDITIVLEAEEGWCGLVKFGEWDKIYLSADCFVATKTQVAQHATTVSVSQKIEYIDYNRLADTIAHEMRHVWQNYTETHAANADTYGPGAYCERDANAYATVTGYRRALMALYNDSGNWQPFYYANRRTLDATFLSLLLVIVLNTHHLWSDLDKALEQLPYLMMTVFATGFYLVVRPYRHWGKMTAAAALLLLFTYWV